MKIFYPDETYDNMWMISIDIDKIEFNGEGIAWYFTSSYNVIAARLTGFDYADWLRYCRGNGATIRGREGYSRAVWKDKKDCQKICDMLNREIEKVLKEVNQ